MRPDRLLVMSMAVVALSACPGRVTGDTDAGSGGGGGSAGGGTATGGGGGSIDTDAGIAKSEKGALRFKGDVRLSSDLAAGLSLPVDSLCKELGQYACTSFVHVIALGGVDPYGKGFYEGLPQTGSTTPNVVDRVVLSACTARVQADLGGSAVIFKNIAMSGDRLSDANSPAVRAAITELANRAWLREPSENEVQSLIALNADIEASMVATPGIAWMQASCFAVFSSSEFLFY